MQGEFIDVFQRAAHGDAETEAGCGNAAFFELFMQIEGCGVAVYAGACCYDDFGGWCVGSGYSVDKFLDFQIVWHDALQRREAAEEDMVDTAICGGFLEGDDVGGFFYHAYHTVVAAGIVAD